jgi:hypothetical protein
LPLFALRAQPAPGSDPSISTDRPSVTNSSVVVPRGGFQAENGLAATNNAGSYVLDLPETNLRYGLLGKTELRLAVPNYFQNLSSDASGASGFGDLALGVKQQLGPWHKFDLSVIFFLSFPTGATAISSHGYDPGAQLPWSRTLGRNWTLGGQAAFYWPTLDGKHNFTGETTFFLDRRLTRTWSAFAEYAGDFPQRGGTRQFLHFGTAYKLTRRQQLDFHVAAGLSDAASRAYVGVGYSFLLVRRD